VTPAAGVSSASYHPSASVSNHTRSPIAPRLWGGSLLAANFTPPVADAPNGRNSAVGNAICLPLAPANTRTVAGTPDPVPTTTSAYWSSST
jgi:hypothetical protein